MKNMHMTHKELVDQVSANLFKQSGKIESQRSWLAMRNYLEQLDSEQLKLMLKEAAWNPQNKNQYSYYLINRKFKWNLSLQAKDQKRY